MGKHREHAPNSATVFASLAWDIRTMPVEGGLPDAAAHRDNRCLLVVGVLEGGGATREGRGTMGPPLAERARAHTHTHTHREHEHI